MKNVSVKKTGGLNNVWPAVCFAEGKEFNKSLIPSVMCNFIQDYLTDPSSAVSTAMESANRMQWCVNIDENEIYSQISSPEFRLYEHIVSARPVSL